MICLHFIKIILIDGREHGLEQGFSLEARALGRAETRMAWTGVVQWPWAGGAGLWRDWVADAPFFSWSLWSLLRAEVDWGFILPLGAKHHPMYFAFSVFSFILWHPEVDMVFLILQKKSKSEEMNSWPSQLRRGRSGCPIVSKLPTLT